ncbi:MAG TPA: hypothetical protein PKM25_05455, partial [Candidatus Ozemobacteraceae bacterium]|nr:hypothetical protein [Candidatus Ozemobacteraceae bacterium]
MNLLFFNRLPSKPAHGRGVFGRIIGRALRLGGIYCLGQSRFCINVQLVGKPKQGNQDVADLRIEVSGWLLGSHPLSEHDMLSDAADISHEMGNLMCGQ